MTLGKDILWLTEDDVAALLPMAEAITAVEKAFRLHGEGKVQLPAKIYLEFDPFGGDLRAMPAYVKSDPPAAGVKIVNSNAANPARGLPAVAGIMTLVDPETGMALAIMGAGNLTGIRTGAAGGLAAKALARSDSRTVGLIGCGRQAFTQLEAIERFFRVDTAFVWGKTSEEVDTFCRLSKGQTRATLKPCATVKEACAADIIVTTTPVREPLVKAEWVRPGTHINAIGADAPGKQELETALLLRSRVYVDEWVQASHAGEINVAVSAGQFTEKTLAGQLGRVLAGLDNGRSKADEITIFDSTGLALQDVAVARLVFDKASKLNKGQVLKLHG